jgi:hypothetical protein
MLNASLLSVPFRQFSRLLVTCPPPDSFALLLLTPVGSLNTGFTLLARGEISIIIVNLALAGGLMPILQPFAALYVLILASVSPLLAKESERLYDFSAKFFSPNRKTSDETNEESFEAAQG